MQRSEVEDNEEKFPEILGDPYARDHLGQMTI